MIAMNEHYFIRICPKSLELYKGKLMCCLAASANMHNISKHVKEGREIETHITLLEVAMGTASSFLMKSNAFFKSDSIPLLRG